MQDFRCVSLDIFYASSEHSEIFISVFYPNWLIIRIFYLNLYGVRTRKRDNRGAVHARKRDNWDAIHAQKRDIGT